LAGGEFDPGFPKQVDDLENYLLHNRRGAVATHTYKTNRFSYGFGPTVSYDMGPSYSESYQLNEIDLESYIKQATKWDEVFVRSSGQIEQAKQRINKFLQHFNGVTDVDVYGAHNMFNYFPWDDFEIF